MTPTATAGEVAPGVEVRYAGKGSEFGMDDIEAIVHALQQDTLAYGPLRDRFEAEFAACTGARHALSTTSCTTALLLAAQVLRLRAGDEVIMTPQTFWATAVGLISRGVSIRFGDIDPGTLTLDPATIEPRITARTKAIYVMDYGGLPNDMEAIMAIARAHGLAVVEDAAHAPGAAYKGRRVGNLADLTCFSFHSLKNMSTMGEGGMLTTNVDRYADEVRKLRSMGTIMRTVPRQPEMLGPYKRPAYAYNDHAQGAYHLDALEIEEVGNNFRMSEVQAAVGMAQLSKLDAMNAKRRAIARRLDEGLRAVPAVTVQEITPGADHIYHLYTCFLHPEDLGARDATEAAELKNRFIEIMEREEKVSIIMRFFPVHLLPQVRAQGHAFGECPVVEKVWFEQQINLPIFPMLTDVQVEHMVDAVRRTVARISG
jgi:perosamine synthetase